MGHYCTATRPPLPKKGGDFCSDREMLPISRAREHLPSIIPTENSPRGEGSRTLHMLFKCSTFAATDLTSQQLDWCPI